MRKKESVYSNTELELNKVIIHQDNRIKTVRTTLTDNDQKLDEAISLAEQTLVSVGKGKEILVNKNRKLDLPSEKKVIVVRTWDEILHEAEQTMSTDFSIRDLFTEAELDSNEAYLLKLREEFDAIHRLDATDYMICGISGVLSAAVDIFMVGMPQAPLAGIDGGTLSNFIRKKVEESLPPNEIKKLEKDFRVPYDPANNSNLKTSVDGLSSYFHRYQSLGHDPILGFVFGVLDVMNGTFTAVDKNGNLIKQVVSNQETAGMEFFDAVDRVFGHMKSDVTTSRGLPAPLMTLLNLFQFGDIGEEGLSVAEVARSMYGQGYDFTHFLSMSVPVVLNEVIVRSSYCAKRVCEGHGVIESLPIDLPSKKKPKLSTMLFISHSIAAAANAGKIAFTQNPLATNYTQWLAFAKYSLSQLKWALIQKPALRDRYVQGFIDNDWIEVNAVLESSWEEFSENAIVFYK